MSAGDLVQVFQSDSVVPGNDEQVPGGDGVQVHEDDSDLILVNHAGLSVTSYDRTKHTLLTANGHHGRILSASSERCHRFQVRLSGSPGGSQNYIQLPSRHRMISWMSPWSRYTGMFFQLPITSAACEAILPFCTQAARVTPWGA